MRRDHSNLQKGILNLHIHNLLLLLPFIFRLWSFINISTSDPVVDPIHRSSFFVQLTPHCRHCYVLFLLSSQINQSFRWCCCCCSLIQSISKSFCGFFFFFGPLIYLFTPKAAEFLFATDDVCKLNGKQRKGVKQKW